MAAVGTTFCKFRLCAHFYRTFHQQITLQCRPSASQIYRNLGRCITLSARNFSVGKNALTNLNDEGYDDDADDDNYTRKKAFKKRSSKFSVAQKGNNPVVRPSRYMFNSKGDSDNGGQWLKKTTSNKHKLEWYTKQLLFLMSENKVDQAQELFDSMKTKNIKPSVEIFNILIAGYGRNGKIRKALHHYNNMKKMGLQPSGHTFTTVFNICSNISSKEISLKQIIQLWEEFHTSVNSKSIQPDIITYNAALKAAASCHNFTMATEIYSNLRSNNIHPESRTYSSLLSACAEEYSNDKVQWTIEEMKSNNIKPDIYVFNAMLKALRSARQKEYINQDSGEQQSELSDEEIIGEYDMTDVMPKYADAAKSSSIFTGVEDFLQLMAVNDVAPDIRTFHLLLQVSDMDVLQEDYVLQVMRDWQYKPDLPVLNALIKRRAFWGDVKKAKEYIWLFKDKHGIIADKSVYHSLGKGCRRMSDGIWLLHEMRVQGYQPGIHVYKTLIKNAAYRNAFQYLTELLKEMKKDHIQPTDELFQLLDDTIKPYHERDSKQKSQHNSRDVKKKDFLRKQQFGFAGFYKNWKDDMTNVKGKEATVKNTSSNKSSEDYSHL